MSGLPDAQMTVPHFVYRLFNQAGDLLYIGCARDVGQRLTLHHASEGCVRVETEVYPTKVDARAAERAAIKNEAPLRNKQHNVKRFKASRTRGGFEALEPIHPITARMLEQESRVVTNDDMRNALALVAARLGIGAA